MAIDFALRALNDYPWFRLAKGDVIRIESAYHGVIQAGSLSWNVNQLWEEIERGDWELLTIAVKEVGDGHSDMVAE
jgi:hypothetical protein